MKPFLIVISLLAVGGVRAQVVFDEAVPIGHEAPGRASFSDLDGDGMEDMIITRRACGSVEWHRRLGPWQFAKPVDIGARGQFPDVTLAGDLNGDGSLDLAVGYHNTLEVFLNEEAGSAFRLEATLPGQLFDLEDLDADGDLDIFTGIHWYPNQGDGSFGQPIPEPYFDTTRPNRESLLADVNGDGLLDAVAIDPQPAPRETLRYYPNLGEGRFETAQFETVEVDNLKGLRVHDFDEDGDLDLATLKTSARSFVIYENDGTGHFQKHSYQNPERAIDSWFTGDFDGDGLVDAVTASYHAAELTLWKNEGALRFTDSVIPLDSLAYAGAPVASHDFDGDGTQELVLSGKLLLAVSLAGERSVLVTPASPDRARVMQSVDVNGDGRADIVVGEDDQTRPALYTNLVGADGWESVYWPLPRSELRGFDHGDLDGDGDQDRVVALGRPYALLLYRNHGDGRFNEASSLRLPGDTVHGARFSDLDGDGDLDLIAHSRSAAEIWWYANDGLGSLSSETVVPHNLPSPIGNLVVSDINGDGISDLLPTLLDNDLYVLTGTLAGTFNEPVQIEVERVYYQSLADWDGDNLDDIVVTHLDRTISWLRNLGDGRFDEPVRIEATPTNALVPQPYFADLDGDGRLELIVARGEEVLAYSYRAGEPAARWVIEANRLSSGVFTSGDYDGDGRVDLAEASQSCPSLRWHRQRSDPATVPDGPNVSFSTLRMLLEDEGFSRVTAEDFNGDGNQDLAFVTAQAQGFGWLRQDEEGRWHEQRYTLPAPDPQTLPSGARLVTLTDDPDFSPIVVQPAQPHDLVLATTSYQATRSGDIDQDGDTDFVVAVHRRLVLFRHIIEGAFNEEWLNINVSTEAWSLVDLDGDDFPDLLGTSHSSEQLSWARNVEGRYFDSPRVLFTGAPELPPLDPILTGDVDGDGDQDVVLTFGSLQWVANQGDGTFKPGQKLMDVEADRAMLGDLDGDGDQDLVLVMGGGLLSWLPNQGAGVFPEQALPIGEAFAVTHVQLVDMDGDGDEDIVLAGGSYFEEGYVGWMENVTERIAPGRLSYSQWKERYQGLGVIANDVDGDDLTNLEEWAFGGHPFQADDLFHLEVTAADSDRHLLQFPYLLAAPESLSYVIAISKDMDTWHPLLTRTGVGPWMRPEVQVMTTGYVVSTSEMNDDYFSATLHITASHPRELSFYRLEVRQSGSQP